MTTIRMHRGALPSPPEAIAAAPLFRPEREHAAALNYIVKPAQLSFWGNNHYSDCVTAEEAFAKACHNPEILISDAEAIDWARRHNMLNGAVISTVLQTMTNDGFRQGGHVYDDGPHFTVDRTNHGHLQNAITVGPVKLGIAADQLNHVYDWRNGWFATGFHNDSKEDHCVALCGFGTLGWLAQQLGVAVPHGVNGNSDGYAMFTWSTIGIIDIPSMLAITQEAWLRNPTTIIR
jgi:hypothetical protein